MVGLERAAPSACLPSAAFAIASARISIPVLECARLALFAWARQRTIWPSGRRKDYNFVSDL